MAKPLCRCQGLVAGDARSGEEARFTADTLAGLVESSRVRSSSRLSARAMRGSKWERLKRWCSRPRGSTAGRRQGPQDSTGCPSRARLEVSSHRSARRIREGRPLDYW